MKGVQTEKKEIRVFLSLVQQDLVGNGLIGVGGAQQRSWWCSSDL